MSFDIEHDAHLHGECAQEISALSAGNAQITKRCAEFDRYKGLYEDYSVEVDELQLERNNLTAQVRGLEAGNEALRSENARQADVIGVLREALTKPYKCQYCARLMTGYFDQVGCSKNTNGCCAGACWGKEALAAAERIEGDGDG